MTDHFITTDDQVKLYYEEYGKGDNVILFIHGYTDSVAGFRHVSPFLGDEFRVITYDLRAHGKSEAPDFGYSMRRYAQDLHCVIEQLDLKDIHVIGYSMGVHIIYEYIKQYGDDVFASLLLTSMSPNIVNDGDYQLGMKGYTIEAAMDAIVNLNDHYEEEKAKTDPATQSWMHEFPHIVEFYANGLHLNEPAMVRLQLAMIANDYWEVTDHITKPTIVIGGEGDIYPVETFETQANRIKGAKLSIIPKLGHLFYLQVPETYAAEIRGFILGLSS